MKIGFDNEKYLHLQCEKILERISKFGDKLYLEFGGKLFDDFHASRVLPGFAPDAKIQMLSSLSDQIEIIIAISAEDIERGKIREDVRLPYYEEIFRLIKAFSLFGLSDISVVITRFQSTKNVEKFCKKLENFQIPFYRHYSIENYPYDLESIVSDDGFWKNDFIPTKKPLVVVTAPGPGSGKMATCLSQLYHENKRGIPAWYAKFETFPVYNLSLNHGVNLAYEAATLDLDDVNMIDPFHLEAYNQVAVNYNRDIEIFPLLKSLFEHIQGKCLYASPTDMGVNMVGFCFSDENIVENAAKNEIIRRYFALKNDIFLGKSLKEQLEKMECIMQKAGISLEDRKLIHTAREKSLQKNTTITAIELDSGEIITGKSSALMSSAAAAVINVLKNLAHINDAISLISPNILEAMQKMKTQHSAWLVTPLDVNEILLALSVSAITSPVAELAMSELVSLRGLDCHSSAILSETDILYLKKLWLALSMESTYENF